MNRTTFHLEFVTPCFLAGANQQAAPEWRAASIRGQLRWWFRAVAGGVLGGDLKRTKAAEAEVFGSTDRRSSLRVSVSGTPRFWPADERWPLDRDDFKLTAAQIAAACQVQADAATLQRLRINTPNRSDVPSSPHQYLGYGCIEYRREQHGLYLGRSCFAPGERAAVRIEWPEHVGGSGPVVSADPWWIFGRALWAWLHLGGLGSSSRNGYGSLACIGISGDHRAMGGELDFQPTRQTFMSSTQALLENSKTTAKGSWTYLSESARILVGTRPFRTWAGALGALGAWAIFYRRRYGTPADPGRADSFDYRNRDYHWAGQAGSGSTTTVGGFPDRAGFGLPLLFDRQRSAVTWLPGNGEEGREDHRRASPVLFHVAKLGEEHYPVVTYLPAHLIPDGAQLRFRRKGNHDTWALRGQPRSGPGKGHEEVVTRFLDFLTSHVAEEVT